MINAKQQPRFCETKQCGHCGNRAPMQVVATFDDTVEETDEDSGPWCRGECYELLKCPACGKIELRNYYYHDGLDPDNPPDFKTLYPVPSEIPLGLPATIQMEYMKALKVRNISANAYGALIGRVLDLVCEDKAAKGKDLDERLADLAAKNEISHKLIPVAEKLRRLRNFGAHANLGELTENEAPILDNLSRAILEYVYSTPHLVEEARSALEKLHQRKNTSPKK